MKLHLNTPLIESLTIGQALNAEVRLKIDALQPSGSFKARGIGHACATYAKNGKTKFVSSSGGNAGMAVAYSGRMLKIPVTVVVPEASTEMARQQIKLQGAKLIVHGASWLEAHNHALTLCDDKTAYLHPFDDPLIWTGHSTIIDEFKDAGYKPDAIVLSVGGGGLFLGIIEGLERHGWNDVKVIACETKGADSFAQSMQARKLIELSKIESIATSLGAKKVAAKALEVGLRLNTKCLVYPDITAVKAALSFAKDHRIIVEPGCGVALAAGYQKDPALAGCKKVAFIVCGGSTYSYEMLQEYNTKHG